MKLRFEHLSSHLSRPLAPVYLLAGEEPLQLREAADAIRGAASQQGFGEREVFHVERNFDWDQLLEAANSLSLFAERRLLELRMPGGKPGDAGAKVLARYTQSPPPDTVLLIISGKTDLRAKWVNGVERAGVLLQVWPLQPGQLPGWVARRLQAKGLRARPEVVRVLAERVEGNLLAADQEIEKLALLCADGDVDEAAVAMAVGDSARFDVFGLVDSALLGDVQRSARMVHGLRAEGIEPVLVLWALARELRVIEQACRERARGQSVEAALRAAQVWERRKQAVGAALGRLSVGGAQSLLRRTAELDRAIKGGVAGNAWNELLQLVLALAGRELGLTSVAG